MRIVLLLTLIYLLTSCQKEKDELIGHWHSIPQDDESYLTLDITDTTTEINKYGGEWFGGEFLRYHEDTGEETLVFDFEKYTDFELTNDTLVINNQLKFFKVEEKHHLNDRFPNSLVRLNLPKPTNNPPIVLPQWKSLISHIYIGPPSKANVSSELINSDSTCFQTWDFIAGYTDIKQFVQAEKDKVHDKEKIWLLIHADSTTSRTTIDSVRALVEPLGITNGFIVSRYNYDQDQMVYEELDSR